MLALNDFKERIQEKLLIREGEIAASAVVQGWK
jgi:hypothetical protein